MENKPIIFDILMKALPRLACVLGLIGYFCNIPTLIIIGLVAYFVEIIYLFSRNEMKSISPVVVAAFIAGIVAVKKGLPLFYTVCCGLFIESAIGTVFMLIVGIISLISALLDKLFYR